MSAENDLGGAAPDHMTGRVRPRPGDDPRHHGGVGDAQTHNPAHAKLGIDDSELVQANLASTNGMPKARGAEPGKFSNLIGCGLRPGNDFGLAHVVQGMLVSQLARGLDGSHDSPKITIRSEIIAIDHGSILEVAAG